MKTQHHLIIAPVLVSSILTSPSSFGAGFQLAERSASGMGRAFSGEAAYAEDASVIASNPAAMIMLGGEWNYSAGLNIVDVSSEVNGTYPTPPIGAPAPTSDDSAGQTSFIPMLYGTKRINDDIVVGLGIFSSYGLVTDYSTSFADQSLTDRSEVITLNFNPSIAWRLNDVVTLGAGASVVYAEGELSSRTPGGFGPLFNLEGDDIAFGYNIGALFEVTDRVNIGVHYRSSINLEIEGDAFLGDAFGLLTGGVRDFDAGLDIELPETAEASLLFRATDQLDLHADVLWTNWGKVERLAPTVSGTAAGPAGDALVNSFLNTDLNWENTFRYAVGATYRYSDKITLRTGVAYDESPVEDSNRTLRIPDRDRIWLSFGGSYHFSESYKLDLGYTHLFAEDSPISENELAFDGEVNGHANLFSLSISGQF